MSHFKIKLSLFINYFLFGLLLNSVGTVILQSQRFYKVSASSASVLEGYKDIAIALISFFVASFITKIGYKRSMQIGLLLVIIACCILPVLQTFWAVKILFAVTGASFALIKISIFGTIGLIVKEEKEHISLMNFIESTFMVGILSGYFIFSWFMNDKDPSSKDWFYTYYLIGFFFLLALLLLSTASLDEKEAVDTKNESISTSFTHMFKLLLIPIIVSFIVCAFLYVLIEQSIMSWLPTFNNQVLKIPSSFSVLMAGLMAGSTALGRFVFGFVAKKWRWIYFLSFCLIVEVVLVLFTLPLAKSSSTVQILTWSDIPMVAYIFPLIGFFLAPIYPAINSVILASLPKHKHASMSGLIVVFSALGGTLGSLITGYIFQHYGGLSAFYFSLIPTVLLLVILIVYNSYNQKQVSATLN
jgi:FHS family glucose/mannose:H+ symporter-like MFS transporter